MIATGHPEVSVGRRCQFLDLPRASYYRGPATGLRFGDLELMRRIDVLYLEHPWMGSRSLADELTTLETPVGRDRVRRLMLIMGIESLAPKQGPASGSPSIRSIPTSCAEWLSTDPTRSGPRTSPISPWLGDLCT